MSVEIGIDWGMRDPWKRYGTFNGELCAMWCPWHYGPRFCSYRGLLWTWDGENLARLVL